MWNGEARWSLEDFDGLEFDSEAVRTEVTFGDGGGQYEGGYGREGFDGMALEGGVRRGGNEGACRGRQEEQKKKETESGHIG